MYFVTTKRDGYILFCTTPSERAAVGLTEKYIVHLLIRESPMDPWVAFAEWSGNDFSHTDFMAAWRNRDEPTDSRRLLDVLPAGIRRATNHPAAGVTAQ